jgi:hypothetical protein
VAFKKVNIYPLEACPGAVRRVQRSESYCPADLGTNRGKREEPPRMGLVREAGPAGPSQKDLSIGDTVRRIFLQQMHHWGNTAKVKG